MQQQFEITTSASSQGIPAEDLKSSERAEASGAGAEMWEVLLYTEAKSKVCLGGGEIMKRVAVTV